MQRRHGWAVVTLALTLGCISAGCSKDPATGPPASVASAGSDLPILPSDALPGYVVHASGLDAATLAADALDPASLDVVLTGAGFETGIERRFTARWKPVTEVVARALRFASADGATAYLTWLRAARSGRPGLRKRQASDPPSLTDAIAFTHAPCTSCTKDTIQYFAAWTHGRYALTLLVGGPRAGRSTATPLAEELDARVSDGS